MFVREIRMHTSIPWMRLLPALPGRSHSSVVRRLEELPKASHAQAGREADRGQGVRSSSAAAPFGAVAAPAPAAHLRQEVQDLAVVAAAGAAAAEVPAPLAASSAVVCAAAADAQRAAVAVVVGAAAAEAEAFAEAEAAAGAPAEGAAAQLAAVSAACFAAASAAVERHLQSCDSPGYGRCFNAAPGRASVGLQRHTQRRAAPCMHLEKHTSGLWYHVRLLRVRRRVAWGVWLVSVRAALLWRRRVGR